MNGSDQYNDNLPRTALDSSNLTCLNASTLTEITPDSTTVMTATGNPVNGSADQSSQYNNCSADKALDGVKVFSIPDELLPTCTCSVTGVKSFPRWWEMDFGSMHLIGFITVTGRYGQSTNLTAFISNNTMETNKSTQVNLPDETTVGLHVRFDPPRIAQYINIKKEDTIDVMTICEVEVFESKCPTGSYGDKCSSNCSEHCIAEECNHVNGMCNYGWKPGYNFLIDPNCEFPCQDGNYGNNCIMSCGECRPNKMCDKVSGICPNGCKMGFKGTTCLEHEKEERRFTASEVAGVAGGSVAGCLLLLGLVHVSVLVYRRYKSASTRTDSANVIPDVTYVNTGRAYEGLYEMPLKNIDIHMYQKVQN